MSQRHSTKGEQPMFLSDINHNHGDQEHMAIGENLIINKGTRFPDIESQAHMGSPEVPLFNGSTHTSNGIEGSNGSQGEIADPKKTFVGHEASMGNAQSPGIGQDNESQWETDSSESLSSNGNIPSGQDSDHNYGSNGNTGRAENPPISDNTNMGDTQSRAEPNDTSPPDVITSTENANTRATILYTPNTEPEADADARETSPVHANPQPNASIALVILIPTSWAHFFDLMLGPPPQQQVNFWTEISRVIFVVLAVHVTTYFFVSSWESLLVKYLDGPTADGARYIGGFLLAHLLSILRVTRPRSLREWLYGN
ncbi:hypothetical protein K470DRAFT_295929 [Piedraia hortae CBS 480.64]|uniref:Uncharacterized protein n=1 Tax=Piedraia hortae CBS 480.64 TaxID=1314780 RepID=A0A6A7BWT6_9PEZI|nr:hypothetical protein K470DRAFT_295929 [Piedraia hortae CBS 480.64]